LIVRNGHAAAVVARVGPVETGAVGPAVAGRVWVTVSVRTLGEFDGPPPPDVQDASSATATSASAARLMSGDGTRQPFTAPDASPRM
jgi:hypothetical protein